VSTEAPPRLAALRAAALLDGANHEFDEGNRRFARKLAREAGEQLRDAMESEEIEAAELPELLERAYPTDGRSIDDQLTGTVGDDETTDYR